MKYLHKEAFCLMQYRSADGTEAEVTWNSRDGVTPFIVHSRSGVEMTHVNWHRDYFAPNHQPRKGQRVFVDATRELVTSELQKYVDRIWDDPQYPASRRWATKADAFEALLADWIKPGSPWLMEWPA